MAIDILKPFTGTRENGAGSNDADAAAGPIAAESRMGSVDARLLQEMDYQRYIKAFGSGRVMFLGIRTRTGACPACREASSRRYNADTLPRLPLVGCVGDGDGYCNCSYGARLKPQPSASTSQPPSGESNGTAASETAGRPHPQSADWAKHVKVVPAPHSGQGSQLLPIESNTLIAREIAIARPHNGRVEGDDSRPELVNAQMAQEAGSSALPTAAELDALLATQRVEPTSPDTKETEKKRGLLGKLNLTVIALLLGVAYLALMIALGTSSPVLVAQGTSMEPGIHAGDLLLNKHVSPENIKVGDTIVFDIPEDYQKRLGLPAKVAHRVIEINGNDGQLFFVTKGDNSDIDPYEVPASRVRGVVITNLGLLGRPIQFLSNRTVMIFLGVPIVSFVLIVMFALWALPKDAPETDPSRMEGALPTLPLGVGLTLDRLTAAVGEYGTHLKSHTSIVRGMAGASEGLEEAVRQQNEVLAELTEVVRDMRARQ